MKKNIFYAMLLLVGCTLGSQTYAQVVDPTWSKEKAEEENAYLLGTEAYIYGLAPWWSYMVIWNGQNQLYDGKTMPFNTWTGMNTLANAKNSRNTLPNVNTLYASAWLDLRTEPLVVDIPPIPSNYFCIPLMDVYQNNFKILDTQSIGTEGGQYAVCGPDFKGAVDPKYIRIDAPTNFVWIVNRVAPTTENEKDIDVARTIQEKIHITPLSQVGNSSYDAITYNKKLDLGSPADLQKDPLNWFVITNKMIQLAPGPAGEAAYMDNFKPICFGPQVNFDPATLSESQRNGLLRGMKAGVEMIMTHLKYGKKTINGWIIPSAVTGKYGYNYLERAGAMEQNIGILSDDAAIYLNSYTDAKGVDYDGNNEYRLHFTKEQIPQVNAFWSITLYDFPSSVLYDNPLNRYQMGPQVEGMMYNKDGSLDVYICHQQPKDKRKAANWIPSPAGRFMLTMRLYSPKADMRALVTGKVSMPGFINISPKSN